MTKAERIYEATRRECSRHIVIWGYQTNPDGSAIGYSGLICKDSESVCTRTLNDVEKILIKERRRADNCRRLGILNDERYEKETHVMNMVETTIRNNRKALAELFN